MFSGRSNFFPPKHTVTLVFSLTLPLAESLRLVYYFYFRRRPLFLEERI